MTNLLILHPDSSCYNFAIVFTSLQDIVVFVKKIILKLAGENGLSLVGSDALHAANLSLKLGR